MPRAYTSGSTTKHRRGTLLAILAIALALALVIVLFWPRPTGDALSHGTRQDAAGAAQVAVRKPGAKVADGSATSKSTEVRPSSEKTDQPPRAPTPPPGKARPETAITCWNNTEWLDQDYSFALDHNYRTNGETSATISSMREPARVGGIGQTVDATPFRGKRVGLSVDLRTQDVTRGATLWISAYDTEGNHVDNKQDSVPDDAEHRKNGLDDHQRLLKDLEWDTAHVELDVPDQARVVTYGVGLIGSGQLWVDDVRIEVVSAEIPDSANEFPANTYGIPAAPSAPTGEPRNLDFESNAWAKSAPCD